MIHNLRSFAVVTAFVIAHISLSTGASAETSKHVYKIGKPYAINGVYYYPREDFRYSETGVASWYGPGFHRKKTANGETYNQNDLTAAHRTLPLPSLVKVTNLENGHALTLVVNDRGPFVNTKNRIIDVSKRAAEILGFKKQGTARVKVDILAKESMVLRDLANEGKPQKANFYPEYQTASRNVGSYSGVHTKGYSWSYASANSNQIRTFAPPKLGTFVQVGAYSKYENARKAGDIVFDAFNRQVRPQITPIYLGDKQCFRVRVGPFENAEHASKAVSHLKGKGLDGTRIVQVQ